MQCAHSKQCKMRAQQECRQDERSTCLVLCSQLGRLPRMQPCPGDQRRTPPLSCSSFVQRPQLSPRPPSAHLMTRVNVEATTVDADTGSTCASFAEQVLLNPSHLFGQSTGRRRNMAPQGSTSQRCRASEGTFACAMQPGRGQSSRAQEGGRTAARVGRENND